MKQNIQTTLNNIHTATQQLTKNGFYNTKKYLVLLTLTDSLSHLPL